MIAAREAMKDSGLNNENIDMEKVGVIVSSGIGGLKTIEEQKFMQKWLDMVHHQMFII